MKRLLMVAYMFPPIGGIGAQRPAKFARYLPEFGWEADVLAGEPEPGGNTDETLLEGLPGDTVIRRVRAPRAGLYELPARALKLNVKWTAVPDKLKGWKRPAVKEGLRMLAEREYDAIYSTSYPYTGHMVGLALKLASGLPWIADFRDPWTGNRYLKPPTAYHMRRERGMERRVLEEADAVVNVTPPLAGMHHHDFPTADRSKFVCITNGFDPADFTDLNGPEPGGRFTLIYAGSFYKYRASEALLDVLTRLKENGTITPDNFRFKVCGTVEKRYQPIFEQLKDIVTVTGYLPHARAVKEMASSSLQLLIIARGPGADVEYTGKLFEYLAARRPILALIPPDGIAADVVREARAGVAVDSEDGKGIEEALLANVEAWNSRTSFTSDQKVISRFSRRETAGELAALLDELCG